MYNCNKHIQPISFLTFLNNFFQINVIPQESVIPGVSVATGTGTHAETTGPAFLSLPPWGVSPMFSTPDHLSLPSDNMPHFQSHYEEVRKHHELLQHQLQDHIQQFLHQQQECQIQGQGQGQQLSSEVMERLPEVGLGVRDRDPMGYQREPSIHWRPSIPEPRQDDSSSRSYLFTSLRYVLQYCMSLNVIIYRFRGRI